MSRGRERERERDDYGPSSAGVRNKVSVLVRNIPLNFTAEDLRAKFEKFGELRDVYIPRDYYTQRSRGFGFIEFRDARDADEAIYRCDRTMLDGREINVCLSKEGRKTPREMMVLETKQTGGGKSGGGYGDSDRRDRRRSRSPRRGSRYSRSRSPRDRGGRYSRSRSPRGRGGRDYERERDRDYDRDRDYGRDRDYDRGYDRDGRGGGGSDRDRDREPDRDYPPRSRSRSRSPRRERERDLSPHEQDAPLRDELPAAQREEGGREEVPFDETAQPVNDYY
ncbi:hypothetical protein PLESTB_000197300 [Pleodorina starrii]|uniref:RRM domain-containing protein n=1 Tax=Pleodorina starrii TaxID=330485 RepID=A0A9W6BCI4_9CHLO|nr:hypothetical protein PLESTM_000334500 [Pleodorina starrii]GLC49235.1 hypothetical protein PLESTB_000197300 [Pleodorina starrii]GLC73513.1 hypothetical protein PLESTF_001385800 [Pleodorina starrii]